MKLVDKEESLGLPKLKCEGAEFGDGFNTFGLNWGIETDSVLGPYIGIFVVFFLINKK